MLTTNYHWHELLALCELPDEARSEFDYVDEDEAFSPRFFKYRDAWHDSHEFELVGRLRADALSLVGWDGFQSDSFYSGVAIRFAGEANDFDLEPYGWVQVATVIV